MANGPVVTATASNQARPASHIFLHHGPQTQPQPQTATNPYQAYQQAYQNAYYQQASSNLLLDAEKALCS